MGNQSKDNKAIKRLSTLFDGGEFTEIDSYAKGADGEIEVVAGFGCVSGEECYAFAQNSDINGGAITVAQCTKIKKIYELATKTGRPVIGVYDSNGVKLTEGFEVLNAFGEVVKAATSVSGVVPQISIIDGACLGTSALMANMADVVIATKDSDFYVTAPSEITTTKSAEEGVIDILVDSFDEAVKKAGEVAMLLPNNNLLKNPMPFYDYSIPSTVPSENAGIDEILASIIDGDVLVDVKADYAQKVVTKLATIEGCTVGIVGFNGQNICPSCSYKTEAFVKLCDSFNIPILTIVNCDGLKKNKESQMLISATKLTTAYASATVPKISLITGQAIGSAYIILAGKIANADITLAWENAVVSPLDVDAAVAFLYNDRLANGEDRNALVKEYKDTLGSAYTAAACGAIDDVIPTAETRTKIMSYLNILDSKRETTIPRKHSVK